MITTAQSDPTEVSRVHSVSTDDSSADVGAVQVGAPLTLRWRIHKGEIPLRRRHLRALEPLSLPEPLMAWIHERLEWAAINLLDNQSEGVLVLDIDQNREVKVSLETIAEPPTLTAADLIETEGFISAVAPGGQTLAGSIWLERGGSLYASCGELFSATETLAYDLAQTLKIPVEVKPQTREEALGSSIFLISDEFGFLLIQDHPTNKAPLTKRMKECFHLW